MPHLLLYVRDMLRAYAAKQQFKPVPHRKARCITGAALLEEFGSPHAEDAEQVARAYPWLLGYQGGCPADEQ